MKNHTHHCTRPQVSFSDDDNGYHKMFEVETGKLVSSFGIQDGGDAMAIDPVGMSSKFSILTSYCLLRTNIE